MGAVFQNINYNASQFARCYLTRLSVLRYTAGLVDQYLRIFGISAGLDPLRGDIPLVDLQVHCARLGTIWSRSAHRLTEDLQDPIEGFRLFESGTIAAGCLSYRAFDSQGKPTPIHQSGSFCGSSGQGAALHGVRIDLIDPAAKKFRLNYRARFADGFESKMVGSGAEVRRDAPMVDLTVQISPRRPWFRI